MDNFEEISYNPNPKLITCVSELRHYNNVHGINSQVLKTLNTNMETINKIINYCFGNSSVKHLINNPKELELEIIKRETIEQQKLERQLEQMDLIENLHDKRKTFCGLGTNKIKRRLNTLAKNGEILAKVYRIALEIEDKNITAKDTSHYYRDKVYFQKHKLILELIPIFKDNNFVYGRGDSEAVGISDIIYFEIPNCEQISFHTNFAKDEIVPEYTTEWDGKKNSTLNKLEIGILKTFPKIIE